MSCGCIAVRFLSQHTRASSLRPVHGLHVAQPLIVELYIRAVMSWRSAVATRQRHITRAALASLLTAASASSHVNARVADTAGLCAGRAPLLPPPFRCRVLVDTPPAADILVVNVALGDIDWKYGHALASQTEYTRASGRSAHTI